MPNAPAASLLARRLLAGVLLVAAPLFVAPPSCDADLSLSSSPGFSLSVSAGPVRFRTTLFDSEQRRAAPAPLLSLRIAA
ncbi:hypothetical protein [Pacificimonas flava]|uniref:Uncharacterized protein n=1 Tax=Pacificimonas flava TaxID=1234595 RepID=M2SDL5_9SPHN|nr:hypothetical protein [Pacificimonas flava]EMD83455.1 hypothetical protein C725_1356 [Pacificimonas flava]MBB5278986.1 hypothetical protein [Pacificimonas flava]